MVHSQTAGWGGAAYGALMGCYCGHWGDCAPYRAFAVVPLGQAVRQLATGAELHDDVHIFVVFQCFMELTL